MRGWTIGEKSTLLTAIALSLYGLMSLACGSGSEQQVKVEQPSSRPSATERANTPRASSAPEGPEAEPVEAPLGEIAEGAAASYEAQGELEVVRFVVDEAGVKMSVDMQPYGDGSKGSTSLAISGAWFINNFVYQGDALETNDVGISEDVILSMDHRKAEAEMLIWATILAPRASERYLDLLIEEQSNSIIASDTLAGAMFTGADAEATRSLLKTRELSLSEFGGRESLVMDLDRIQPSSLAEEHIRLVVLRQQVKGQVILVYAGLRGRSQDFASLVGDFDAFLKRVELLGDPLSLNLNSSTGLVSQEQPEAAKAVEEPELPGEGEAAQGASGEAAAGASEEILPDVDVELDIPEAEPESQPARSKEPKRKGL